MVSEASSRYMPYVPKRGDVVWISLNPQAGHEQAGRRPALILSPESYNSKVGLALLCPITNKSKGYPFEVTLPVDTAVSGVVLSDQIKCLNWRVRTAEHICHLDIAIVRDVLQKLGLLLSLDDAESYG